MTEVRQKIEFDVTQPATGLERLALLTDKLDNSLQGLNSTMKKPFKEAEQATRDFNRELSNGTRSYQKIENTSKAFKEEQKRLKTVLDDLTKSQKKFVAEGRYEELQQNIAGVKKRISELKGEVEETNKKTSDFGRNFAKIGGIIAGVFAFDKIVEFSKKVFGVTAEFQKFEAVLTNSLGSNSKAQQALGMIQDFAAKTPFSVQQLTDSFIKLTNQGMKPTAVELRKYGDLASSTGKSFDQLTEAIIDAAGGMEFERLKEFGIRAEKDGDKVRFTFKGITTEVKATSDSIKGYISNLGELQGVSGSMAAISKTLGGALSNAGDNLDKFLLTLGTKLTPFFTGAIGMFSKLTGSLTELMNSQESANRVGLETIQANQKQAASAKGLLNRYQELYKEGVEPTTKEKAELDRITLQLKDTLGDSVVAIDAETGALKLNQEAVKESIKQKLLLANQEASTLALRINTLKDEGAALETTRRNLREELRIRKQAAKELGLTESNLSLAANAAGYSGGGFGGAAAATYTPEQIALAKKYSETLSKIADTTEQMAEKDQERQELLKELSKLGFTTEDVNKLFNEVSEATAEAGNKVVQELSAMQRAQITQYRALVDDTREYDTALTDKELSRLFKAIKNAKIKAIAELEKELADLKKKAAQAELDMMDSGSRAYLDAKLASDLKQIDELEAKLKEKAKAANTQLTKEQQEQIEILKNGIRQAYAEDLFQYERQQRETLLELQKDSDKKEMQQLINKYDERIRLARKMGQEEVAIALEVEKEREAATLTKTQANKDLDYREAIISEGSKLNLNRMQGIDPVELERMKQQKLLDIQIEFTKKRLSLIANETDDESLLRQLQLKNLLTELEKEKQAAIDKQDKFSLQKLLGLTDEQMEAVNQAVNYTLGQLQDFLATSVAMREREVEALTRAIDEKGRELDREIELNQEGFASNVETKQQEYEALKAQREKAIKDQQKAQRAQMLLDTAMQASNLITASAEIFKVTAPYNAIPGVGTALAIGLIATMAGAFIAAKAKAYQATTVPTYGDGGEGKLIKGPSHAQGGIDLVENRSGKKIANIEGGENFYVTNKKSTDKFWPWLEAINNNDMNTLSRLAIDDLLQGTGVLISNPELPKKLQQLQVGAQVAKQEYTIRSMKSAYQADPQLKEIGRDIKEINERGKGAVEVLDTDTHRVERKGNRTRIINKDIKDV